MKDKIILKDGTTLEIEQSSSTGDFTLLLPESMNPLTILEKLTPDNLSEYQVQNQAGLVVARPENKECKKCVIEWNWDQAGNMVDISAAFELTNVDMISKRIAALEETTEILVQESLLGSEEQLCT